MQYTLFSAIILGKLWKLLKIRQNALNSSRTTFQTNRLLLVDVVGVVNCSAGSIHNKKKLEY